VQNMTTLTNLLDTAKEKCNAHTDMALAAKLHVSRASVSNWRHGRNYPDTVQCGHLADLTGEPLPRVLGIVGEARAISADEKRVWRRLANAAAIAAIAVGFLPTPAAAGFSDSAIAQAERAHGLCIMRSGRTMLRRAVTLLQRLWHAGGSHAPAPALLAC
jgi:transcriptional regulator with XRE-family HTH domain